MNNVPSRFRLYPLLTSGDAGSTGAKNQVPKFKIRVLIGRKEIDAR